MKTTHDGRKVYPVGSNLPYGAIGWTQCRLCDGGYSEWIDSGDIVEYRESLDDTEYLLKNVVKTKAIAIDLMNKLGIHGSYTKLKDMKSRLRVYFNEKHWPLLEN